MIQIANSADDLRIASRRILARTLRANPGVVVGELAQKTPLGTGTVSTIANEMTDAGVVVRTEIKAAGRGRPKVSLDFASDFKYALLFRTSAKEVEGSLVDFKGVLKDRLYRRREGAAEFQFIDEVVGLSQEFLERQNLDPSAIGIVSVTVKAAHGPHVTSMERSGLSEVTVAEALGLPPSQVAIEHEQGLVAYSLLKSQPDEQRVAVLSIGNSVSLAIAQRTRDGEIAIRSPNLGHSITHPNGSTCLCGKKGCVEATASAFGLLRATLGGPGDVAKMIFIPDEQILSMGERVRSGDFQARQGFAIAGEALGFGLGQVFNLIGVMPVWIMGQTSPLFDLLEPSMLTGLGQSIGEDAAASVRPQLLSDQEQRVFESNSESALDKLDWKICETGFRWEI